MSNPADIKAGLLVVDRMRKSGYNTIIGLVNDIYGKDELYYGFKTRAFAREFV